MRSKISPTQRGKVAYIHLCGIPRKSKSTDAESHLEVTRGGEKGGVGSFCSMGTEFLIGVMTKVWKWNGIDTTELYA